MKNHLTLATWLFLLIHNTAIAGEVTVQTLATGSTSWDGGSIKYPQNDPQITVQKIAIDTDGKEITLATHCHTTPLAAYVLKGKVKVVKPSGEERLFEAGDAFIEVMNAWHRGVISEDTELLVFYAGESGVPLSIKQDGDKELSNSCR